MLGAERVRAFTGVSKQDFGQKWASGPLSGLLVRLTLLCVVQLPFARR